MIELKVTGGNYGVNTHDEEEKFDLFAFLSFSIVQLLFDELEVI